MPRHQRHDIGRLLATVVRNSPASPLSHSLDRPSGKRVLRRLESIARRCGEVLLLAAGKPAEQDHTFLIGDRRHSLDHAQRWRLEQQLGALADIIDKDAAHGTANKIEESALLQDRLNPDMFCLARQVRQSAAGMDTGARLAGATPPALPGVDDTTFADAKNLVETARPL